VNGKFFTRLRREDQSVVLTGISMDEREMLMEAEPATFHITAHYKDYPSVLARIETLHPGSFRNFLERTGVVRRLVRTAEGHLDSDPGHQQVDDADGGDADLSEGLDPR
jgi:hypothetical protein